MASLSNAKVLGGVGGILAIIPGISLVGWILILVALKEVSDVTRDRSIFDDAIIAGITAIIGAITFIVFLASGTFGGLITLGAIAFGPLGALGALAFLGVFWVFLIVSSIFLKRAYDKTAQRLNVGAFATAGLLYLIGALTVIVLVGFLILLIAMVFQIVAYFSIQDQPSPAPYPGYQTPSQRGLLYQLWNQAIVASISYRSHLSWPGARDTQISTNATTHFRRFLKIMSTAVRGSYQRGSGTLQWVDGGMWPRWRGRILSLS